MNWFINWKIRTKILSLVALMTLFISIVGFVGYYYNAKANAQMTDIYSNNLMSIKYLNDARAQSSEGEAVMFDFLLATDKDTQQTLQNDLKAISANYDKSYSNYMEIAKTPYQIERTSKIQSELTVYRAERQKAIDIANQGDKKGAYDYLSEKAQPHLDLIETSTQELADFNNTEPLESLVVLNRVYRALGAYGNSIFSIFCV